MRTTPSFPDPLPAKDPTEAQDAMHAVTTYLLEAFLAEARSVHRLDPSHMMRILMRAWNEPDEAMPAEWPRRWRKRHRAAASLRRRHRRVAVRLHAIDMLHPQNPEPESGEVEPALLYFRLGWGRARQDATCTLDFSRLAAGAPLAAPPR